MGGKFGGGIFVYSPWTIVLLERSFMKYLAVVWRYLNMVSLIYLPTRWIVFRSTLLKRRDMVPTTLIDHSLIL